MLAWVTKESTKKFDLSWLISKSQLKATREDSLWVTNVSTSPNLNIEFSTGSTKINRPRGSPDAGLGI
jgi:hypothetical protein